MSELKSKKSDVPTKAGYYWAKWRIPADGTHGGKNLCPSDTWEIVEVWENTIDPAPKDDEALAVSVHGVRETQWKIASFGAILWRI